MWILLVSLAISPTKYDNNCISFRLMKSSSLEQPIIGCGPYHAGVGVESWGWGVGWWGLKRKFSVETNESCAERGILPKVIFR